ncbi:MAG: excinuclease ABC subunit UvrA [Gammaproteobacteria bacterium]|nr:excinuclease ABC subunit UvrA [Gammaproteobacteria bacterium]
MMRSTILVQGSRVHNLKNLTVELPRDKLIVVTGLSGSGKSSLAFDTIYAEGQRRYMESLSSYAKRFIAQVEKPDVDFIYGLSPVISIEQKTLARNPRSTVGTLTDISSYLNLLFATIADGHCPYTNEPVPIKTTSTIVEALMSLPAGTEFELLAPVFQIYGEEPKVLFTEIRKQGCRKVYVEDELIDLTQEVPEALEGDPRLFAVVDQITLVPGVEKQLKAAVEHTLRVGDSLMTVGIVKGLEASAETKFVQEFGSKTHGLAYGDIVPDFFMFNNPESACRTCGGVGRDKQTHPDLLVTNPELSIREGCFLRDAFSYKVDQFNGYLLYSVAEEYGFSLDTPWRELSEEHRKLVMYGTQGKLVKLQIPPDVKERKERWLRWPSNFRGVAGQIESHYRWYKQRDVPNSGMEAYLDRVMVEYRCADCKGTRLKHTRVLFTVDGHSIFDLGQFNLDELCANLNKMSCGGRNPEAGQQIRHEIIKRLELLLGIGLDYLNLNRTSGTLSGGEAQRIRLSTQIGSGLMGMLYVLDEPSIGLHPRDNEKMIKTLRSMRDLGNTVIVVEHDEDTIRAADHLIELGPGPGVHGGQIVVNGSIDDLLQCSESLTGQYLSGQKAIDVPNRRRIYNGKTLTVLGAAENNLKTIDVELPLGLFVCVTGASGSGKSTLVNEILFKELWKQLVDTRSLSGQHQGLEGIEHITRVINIDQTPIGRNSRSNPSTYVGVYDLIRNLFAKSKEAVVRGYKPGRFSFNVKGGRCDECQGEGVIATKLYFMPDVEVICGTCKGQRFNQETLEIEYNGKTIADVLDLSIEEAVDFFQGVPSIAKKISVLNELGLGYLTLGQSATTLSGGEAQRVKLGAELSKLQRRGHTLYILDEPTTGLHLADISKLLECLNRLVESGNTVLVIEHHLDVIKTADYVIDLGPEGGKGGGEVIATGTPEEIASSPSSYTGYYLRGHLEPVQAVNRA